MSEHTFHDDPDAWEAAQANVKERERTMPAREVDALASQLAAAQMEGVRMVAEVMRERDAALKRAEEAEYAVSGLRADVGRADAWRVTAERERDDAVAKLTKMRQVFFEFLEAVRRETTDLDANLNFKAVHDRAWAVLRKGANGE